MHEGDFVDDNKDGQGVLTFPDGRKETVSIFVNDQQILRAAEASATPLTVRDIRGEEAMAWFRDAEVLARMRALIRQYKQMPLDQETLEELCGLRRVVAQLWLDVEVAQLQTLHQTAVGAITRALLLAGFGDELLDATDERARRELLPLARDLSHPRAAGHLLALLLFVLDWILGGLMSWVIG